MSTTPHFGLNKPAESDITYVSDLNENADIIDTEMFKPPLSVNGITPNPVTRDIPVTTVPKKICFSKKIGGTIYDVTANFDVEGKETILQQFKVLILAKEL